LFGRTFFYVFKPIFEIFYPAKSEYFFKKKYATDWEPFYIFYYPRLNIRIFLAIINAIYNGGIAGLFVHKLKLLFMRK